MDSPRSTRAQQERAMQEALSAARAREARQRKLVNTSVAVVLILAFGAVAGFAFSNRGTAAVDANGELYVAKGEAFRLPGLLDDKPVSLLDHLGSPVVVNFFASWCVYCNEELPGFIQVAKASTGQVDFIGVDTSDPGDGAAMARRFDLAGAGFDLARDIGVSPASDLWAQFRTQGLPVTAFYDSQGHLVDFSGGMLTQAELEQRLRVNFGIDVSAPDAGQLAAPVIPLIPRGAYELLARNAGDPSFVALDIRPAAQFHQLHIPGAVSIESGPDALPAAFASLDKSASYFLYDQTGAQVEALAVLMHDAGFKHVYYIEGGFVSWAQQGMPTTS